VIADPLDSFPTLNHFFYRRLKSTARPIAMSDDPTVITSPADCRLHVFEKAYHNTFFIKSREFTVSSLLGDDRSKKQLLTRYQLNDPTRTSLVMCRLSPTDYHRFHSPIDGIVGDYWTIGSNLHSVKPIVVNSDVPVYTENRRTILLIESPIFGVVVYVMVGATEVGSIMLNVKTGDRIQKGDEIGYFAYGGSALVLLFPTPIHNNGAATTVIDDIKQIHIPSGNVTTNHNGYDDHRMKNRTNHVVGDADHSGGGSGSGSGSSSDSGRSRFVLDTDLIENTQKRHMETLVEMGSPIGRVVFINTEPAPITPGKSVSG